MYLQEDIEAHPVRKPPKNAKQREAEARLANLDAERKRKKFWQDFKRREERFQRCQSSGGEFKATARSNFLSRSFTKGFRRSKGGREAHLRRAVLGSTDGFTRGLSQSHGQAVPEQLLRRAFSEIDVDGDGLISVRALTRALRRCGVDASKATVQRILQDCGYEGRELTVEQFVRFFRATERLVWSVDDEYNPADGCCLRLGRFLLFLLLVGILVLSIMLLRMEPYTEIWVWLLIAWASVLVLFLALMIPVICMPLRRAVRLGQRRRAHEAEALAAVRAREQRGTAARGRAEPASVAELATQVEAYNPERYWAVQDARVRQGNQQVRPAWAGALSTEALEDDRRKRNPGGWQMTWQPQPHDVPGQQPKLHSTMEILESELELQGSKRAEDKKRPRKIPSDVIMTDM